MPIWVQCENCGGRISAEMHEKDKGLCGACISNRPSKKKKEEKSNE